MKKQKTYHIPHNLLFNPALSILDIRLYTHLKALSVLGEHPTDKDLTLSLSCTTATINRSLRRLESENYLVRNNITSNVREIYV